MGKFDMARRACDICKDDFMETVSSLEYARADLRDRLAEVEDKLNRNSRLIKAAENIRDHDIKWFRHQVEKICPGLRRALWEDLLEAIQERGD